MKHDKPQPTPKCRLLQFGPLVSGFSFVRAVPTGDGGFSLAAFPVHAFGLAELNYSGGLQVRIEPVAMQLDLGGWDIAQEFPGYCGIIRDGEPLESGLIDIDPYYEERLIERVEA